MGLSTLATLELLKEIINQFESDRLFYNTYGQEIDSNPYKLVIDSLYSQACKFIFEIDLIVLLLKGMS